MNTELTDTELRFLIDQQFLLTKRSVQKKLFKILGEVESEIKEMLPGFSFHFPEESHLKSGKISKGENYKGLPFHILDYPRLFTQKSVFAYRCMFWWGNHFSTTLHIGGKAKDNYSAALLDNFIEIKSANDFIGIGMDPWEYHYQEDNYRLINTLDFNQFKRIIDERKFVKISNYLPLDEYSYAKDFALENLKKYIGYLST